MKTVKCPDCGQELDLPESIKPGDIIDCPFWAALSLRLREEGSKLVASAVKKASCPSCTREIIIPDDAKPGDIIRCCNKDFRLTYEFGSYALE